MLQNSDFKCRGQVTISKIRIGHQKLTHTFFFFFKGKQQPECIICDCPLTMQHKFLKCSDTFLMLIVILYYLQTKHKTFCIALCPSNIYFFFFYQEVFFKISIMLVFCMTVYIYFHFYFYVIRMDVKYVPVSRIPTPFTCKRSFRG